MKVDGIGAASAANGIELANVRSATTDAAERGAAVVPVSGVAGDGGSGAEPEGTTTRAVDPTSRAAQGSPLDSKALAKAVEDANRRLVDRGTQLNFQIDDRSGALVVKLIDTATKEVLRQMPSREALAVARALAADVGKPGAIVSANA